MAQPLLPNSMTQREEPARTPSLTASGQELADLRIFWGPEICRLEYLVHLLDTGRVKDDRQPPSA